MALNDLELSLMAFPQRWAPAGGSGGGTLQLNVLLLPVATRPSRWAAARPSPGPRCP